MSLALPDGAVCFVDANIFVYHFVELGEISATCREFLGRIARSEVRAVTTFFCLSDAVHRVMGVEAQEQFKLSSGAITWLQRHPERIRELSAYREAARQLDALPLQLLTSDSRILVEAAELGSKHGLMTNDAIIVALMQRYEVPHLATNDDDFDAIAHLTLWKPRPA